MSLQAKRQRLRNGMGQLDSVSQFTVAFTLEYLLYGGGGGGGASAGGGGGGAGGRKEGTGYGVVTSINYLATIGAGGTRGATPAGGSGGKGNDSVFDTITAEGSGYCCNLVSTGR